MKKALLIGCNYLGSNNELGGCINDTIKLEDLLIEKLKYKKENITFMTDYSKSNIFPTRRNIISQLNNFVKEINNLNIKEAWFSFSGHGTYITDRNGDETDGKDEGIVPLDYQNGIITDDILNNIFSKIHKECKLFCMFDCCHSGTISDLKYKYHLKYQKPRYINVWQKLKYKIYKKWNYRNYLIRKILDEKWLWKNSIENNKNEIICDMCVLSGCKDNQTSDDVYNKEIKKWGGALTNSFVKCLSETKVYVDYNSLLTNLNKYMKLNNNNQQPVLSSNNILVKEDLFYINVNINSFLN